MTVKMDGEESSRSVGAQWVVDASGRAATIARKMGFFSAMTELPTSALWARFSGSRTGMGWRFGRVILLGRGRLRRVDLGRRTI